MATNVIHAEPVTLGVRDNGRRSINGTIKAWQLYVGLDKHGCTVLSPYLQEYTMWTATLFRAVAALNVVLDVQQHRSPLLKTNDRLQRRMQKRRGELTPKTTLKLEVTYSRLRSTWHELLLLLAINGC